MTAGVAPSRLIIISTQRWNSAPTRSILFTKQILGTRYLSACRQTVSDCGSTPATASNTATAPSSTRSDRSTSAVKSTWPGVSMMLMRISRQKQVVAADVIVIPRSCSCSIRSEPAQRPLGLGGEVHVARRVDDVDAHLAPEAGRRRRCDRDPALLLLLHQIGARAATARPRR